MFSNDKIKLIEKHDIKHIGILTAIALAIGIYLIITTVLICKDGVFYIERAQQITSDPVRIIERHPPGYPFMIMATHRCAILLTGDSSVNTWIYCAQSITLLCRILAIIPLYLIGKLLVGSRNSFIAMLILLILPYPAELGSDVIREWPYLLFLSSGFFFLLWAAKSGKWWLFGLVGLITGFGYLIRPESAQLIIFGILWVAVSLFRPKLWHVTRSKSLVAIVLLLIAFAIPTVPYIKYSGKVLPNKVKQIINTFSANTSQGAIYHSEQSTPEVNYNKAEMFPGDVLKALGEIFGTIGENLMWFFMPALIIGLLCRFRNNAEYIEVFFITSFVLTAITMMVLRYCISMPHINQRWSLPLVVFTIYYIPMGLAVMAKYIENQFQRNRHETDYSGKNNLSCYIILLVIGIAICMPKLLRPTRIEKRGYIDTANWLRQNTDTSDLIALEDRRITLNAERKGLRLSNKSLKRVRYIVGFVKNGEEKEKYLEGVHEKYSVWSSKAEKKKKIVIYEAY